MKSRRARGFSLLELLVVLVITGIIGVSVSVFIRGPIQSYVDQSRRAELVDLAEVILQRMVRDIHRALPNSVRTDGTTLELLSIKDTARYRTGPIPGPGGGNPARRLQFNQADTAFNVMGPRAPDISIDDRLVIYHLGDGQAGGSAYQGDDVITADSGVNPVLSVDPSFPDEYRITLDPPGHQFAFESPTQRLYVVEGPVTYFCDLASGALRRYSGYAIQPAMPADMTNGTLIASGVTQCAFSYSTGTASRNAIVTLQVAITRDGETVSLTRQAQVVNAP